jgi:hypothetical protein
MVTTALFFGSLPSTMIASGLDIFSKYPCKKVKFFFALMALIKNWLINKGYKYMTYLL